jgi:hypothetical protein
VEVSGKTIQVAARTAGLAQQQCYPRLQRLRDPPSQLRPWFSKDRGAHALQDFQSLRLSVPQSILARADELID